MLYGSLIDKGGKQEGRDRYVVTPARRYFRSAVTIVLSEIYARMPSYRPIRLKIRAYIIGGSLIQAMLT